MKRIHSLSSNTVLVAALLLTLLLPASATAAPSNIVAEIEVFSTSIVFHPVVEHKELLLAVTGPCNFEFRRTFRNGENPFFKLNEETIDGIYRYSLVAIPKVDPDIIEILKRARQIDDNSEVNQLCRDGHLPGDPVNQSDGFLVANRKIQWVPGSAEEESGFTEEGGYSSIHDGQHNVAPGGIPLKDFVINDDLIVDGSACIGFDCVNGESFGFDTIRLKENNLRIKFEDTSVASSFPRNDWQLTANDSANGGTSKFSIDDISGNRTPFTVEANARSHSLYVDDGGRIGNRTSTPSTEIHTIDGDTPTLRLQQDGSSGFAPQTWDVAGNETNFFIRDVTNGSTLPFRIRPGAPTSSIFVDVDGDVGLGTASPDANLHLSRSSGNVQFLLDSSASDWRMTNLDTNGNLLFQRDDGTGFEDVFVFRTADAALPGFNVTKTMSVAGEIEASSFDALSSRSYKTELVTLEGTSTLDRLLQMPISAWRYNWEESGARRLGPMAEDFTAAFEVGDGRSISLGDASGVAFSAIQGLNERLFEQLEKRDALIGALERRIAELETRVSQ